ncbi:hypothetical protein GCM10022408_37350 [Hymenobacter fastidiosus]|uniref:Uncharacterized protein n=1 Tax=Hymenobacter fastidiosus TaxID=486264 RepID=A0ABP7T1M7_9BACT
MKGINVFGLITTLYPKNYDKLESIFPSILPRAYSSNKEPSDTINFKAAISDSKEKIISILIGYDWDPQDENRRFFATELMEYDNLYINHVFSGYSFYRDANEEYMGSASLNLKKLFKGVRLHKI